MDYFNYQNGHLMAEQVSLQELAEQYGTPLYVYSRATLERHWKAFDEALGDHRHLVCYAVKANSSLAVLNLLARLGSGFDIVSGGELERVIRAGGDPAKTVFSGVGKTRDEIRRGLEVGIKCFNVESVAELELINSIAGEMGQQAPVSIRVNPDVDALTHPYISTGLKENKFGIPHDEALAVYEQARDMAHIDISGIDCHIGSQLTQVAPFVDALERVLELVDALKSRDIQLRHIDMGGGLGIQYRDEQPPSPADLAHALGDKLANRDMEILIEPGRAIAGNAGVLLTRVLYLKHGEEKNFAIIDAAMNDLMRPSLYGAWQNVVPLTETSGAKKHTYDLVGPVCETGDFLAKDRELALQPGDVLAVRSSGAYGFSMSSNYNTRPRAAEILVDGDRAVVIRERETLDDCLRGERTLDD